MVQAQASRGSVTVARVPTYDAPQAQTNALPGVRDSSVASPGLLGAKGEQQVDTGRALMSAGNALSDVAVKMQERENADKLFQAETALKEAYGQFENDVKQRKGQQAWGATKDAEKWFEEAERKHSETLTNDVQRRLFKQQAAKLRVSAVNSISGYESGERRRSLEESAQASIVGSINLAAASHTDPTVVATAKGDVVKRVQVMADLNGWSPERKAAEETRHLTNLHKQVIQAKIENDPEGAKAYYDANKGEIAGADQAEIEKVVDEGTLRAKAQRAVDDIMSKGLSMQGALAEARAKYSGKEEDEVTRRIKERFAEVEAARRLDERDASDAAWKIVTQGGGYDGIPAPVWSRMGGADRKHVLDYLDAKARRKLTDDDKVKDDYGNLAQVEKLIEQGDITDKAQLARYEPYFKTSTLKMLGAKIDKRSTVPAAEVRRAFEDRLGKTRSKWGDAEQEQWLAFQDYIYGNVRETKRPEDVDAWADKWFMSGYGKDDSVLRNDPDTFGEAVTKGRKDFVIRAPEAVRADVDAAIGVLKKAGANVPAGKEAVDEFYTKFTLDAERWFNARGIPSSPNLVAAYALLKQNGKPVTPANLDYVAKQLK